MSDLRAAAERIVESDGWDYAEGVADYDNDVKAIVADWQRLKAIEYAANPADGGEPWDLAWLFDQGADVQGRFDLGGAFYIQFYRSDMSPTLNHEYPGAMNSTLEEYIDLPTCPTKSDVLDLLRAMGYQKPGGGGN